MKDIFSVTDYKDDTIPLEYWIQIIAKKMTLTQFYQLQDLLLTVHGKLAGF